jgi:hypothetical protein
MRTPGNACAASAGQLTAACAATDGRAGDCGDGSVGGDTDVQALSPTNTTADIEARGALVLSFIIVSSGNALIVHRRAARSMHENPVRQAGVPPMKKGPERKRSGASSIRGISTKHGLVGWGHSHHLFERPRPHRNT